MSEKSYEPLIVIGGPTAVGKTAVAVELAKLHNAEIISADSMQVYKYLSIGTAKPTLQETGNIPYHLVDFVDPDKQYNAGMFVDDAERLIAEIHARGKRVVVCGGTGMYIRSLLHGMFKDPSRDEELRKKLAQRAETEGLTSLYDELQQVDPEARHIQPNDRMRIIRALEVFHVTGRPLSQFHDQSHRPPTYKYAMFILNRPREELYQRISKRVDAMVEHGLLDEVQTYIRAGFSEANPCLRALGYGELIAHVRGAMRLEDSLEAMKRKSRNFAKRQLTWFRAVPDAVWIDVSSVEPHRIALSIYQQVR